MAILDGRVIFRFGSGLEVTEGLAVDAQRALDNGFPDLVLHIWCDHYRRYRSSVGGSLASPYSIEYPAEATEALRVDSAEGDPRLQFEELDKYWEVGRLPQRFSP